jgi:rhomboid protease GluP
MAPEQVEDSPRDPRPARREGLLARLRQAPATATLLVVLLVAFLASSADPDVVRRFAKVSARVRAGELWRLVTASFLHGGLPHLAVNAYALSAIGPSVERLYGRTRFAIVFVAGGVAGFVASTLFVEAPSLGASAGLFALLGILLGFAVRARRLLAPASRRAMIREILFVAALNLAFGLMVPYVDNAAHVGGFVGGLALSLVLRPRRTVATSRAAMDEP